MLEASLLAGVAVNDASLLEEVVLSVGEDDDD